MSTESKIDAVYARSDDIVARDIEGELIIIPVTAGIADTLDDLFTVNETAREIWDRLDGRTSLRQVVADLSAEHEAPPGEIEEDVLGFVQELLNRKILVEVKVD